jgi:hypothetical protein
VAEQPAFQPRKQCNGGSTRCRAEAARLCQISRLSTCQKDSDGTDGAHAWRYRTRSGRANSACLGYAWLTLMPKRSWPL